ncbi:MAG: GTPase HflX [Candidatus Cloacimonas sp.]
MEHENYSGMEEYELEPEVWEETEKTEQTAFIAALGTPSETDKDIEESLNELERLAETASIDVLGAYRQRRTAPDRATYFGKGFLTELSQKMLQAKADLLIVNDELSPSQARNMENEFQIKVIDRTEVILNIFHHNAKTKEAKLQVRLAELEYQLPRLKRLWEHFDKERGGVRNTGGTATRGMGEKQIEIDRRLIKDKIRKINTAIENIQHQKETQRKQRKKSRKICLVGYTNAGKSTLFNQLTQANVLVDDKLFATLDSTTRQLKLSTGYPAVISDTVGFISKLPHHLVASFKATLMEVQDADLLLHIVDVSDARFEYYIQQVNSVLQQIGAENIPQIVVFNKADQVDVLMSSIVKTHYPESIMISALQGKNIDNLLAKVEEILLGNRIVYLKIPYEKTALVSKLHAIADILNEDYQEDGIYLKVEIGKDDRYLVENYVV